MSNNRGKSKLSRAVPKFSMPAENLVTESNNSGAVYWLVKENDGDSSKIEGVIEKIAMAILEFTKTVNIPRKINFWWVIANVNAIRKLLEAIMAAIKTK